MAHLLSMDNLHMVPGKKELESVSSCTSAAKHNVVNFSHWCFDSQLF